VILIGVVTLIRVALIGVKIGVVTSMVA
jgi:hypothetical protein